MSVGDLIDLDFDFLLEDNMDCDESCVGSLPHAQCHYAERPPLGLFTTRDEAPTNLIVQCEAERNPTSEILVPSENPSMAGTNFTDVCRPIRH